MELLVFRHAIATPRSPDIEDATRALTDKGRTRFRGVAKGLRALGVRFDRVYHSPWLRAVQTAELLAGIAKETVVSPALAQPPEDSLLAELEGATVGLVGHEPWVSETVSWLLTGQKSAASFVFKKGGVGWLEGEPRPGGMALKAFLAPRVLRSVG